MATTVEAAAPAPTLAPLGARAHEPLLATVALGALADALLREGIVGVGATLWVATLLAALLTLVRRRGRPVTVGAALLAALALLLAAALAWHDAPGLLLLDHAALATTLCALGAALARGDELPIERAGPGDYVQGVLAALGSLTGGAPSLARAAARAARDAAPASTLDARRAAALVALRGVLLAVPALLVFGALFVAADPAFARLLGELGHVDVGVTLSHLLVVLVGAWAAGALLHWALVAPPAPLADAPPLAPATRSAAAEVCVALALLDVLFLAFVVVELGWLFGGRAVVATTDVSYAEYARRGFFELVTAAALALPLLLAAHALAAPERARPPLRLAFRVTAATLLALLGVIMLSAADRMRLYQAAYGLTEPRFVASAGMAWLAVVFAWAGATLLRDRVAPFALGTVVSAWLGVLTLQAIDPAARVAASSATRATAGLRIDAPYLGTLGADAAPTLVVRTLPALAAAGRREEYCTLGHAILRADAERASEGWRLWRLARARARRAVTAAAPGIVAACGPLPAAARRVASAPGGG